VCILTYLLLLLLLLLLLPFYIYSGPAPRQILQISTRSFQMRFCSLLAAAI
jgi:hypothetical protein